MPALFLDSIRARRHLHFIAKCFREWCVDINQSNELQICRFKNERIKLLNVQMLSKKNTLAVFVRITPS